MDIHDKKWSILPKICRHVNLRKSTTDIHAETDVNVNFINTQNTLLKSTLQY